MSVWRGPGGLSPKMPTTARGSSTSGRGGGRGEGGRGSRATGRGSSRNAKPSYEKLKAAGGGKPTAEQQKSVSRAEALGLPPHLLMGLTYEGLKKVVDDFLAATKPQGKADGWALREHMRKASKGDGLSMAERLLKQGTGQVGVATIVLSWHLGSSPTTLLSALDNLIESTSCTKDKTCFWVRDLSVRATSARAAKDLERLKDVVASVGHTVLFLEKGQLYGQSKPLRCAYCLCELAYTGLLSVPFDVTLTDPDETMLHLRLIHTLELFAGTLAGPPGSVVSTRRASCRPETKHEDASDLLVVQPDGTLSERGPTPPSVRGPVSTAAAAHEQGGGRRWTGAPPPARARRPPAPLPRSPAARALPPTRQGGGSRTAATCRRGRGSTTSRTRGRG